MLRHSLTNAYSQGIRQPQCGSVQSGYKVPVISGVSDYGVPAVRGSFLGIMARTEEKTVGGHMSAQEHFSKETL